MKNEHTSPLTSQGYSSREEILIWPAKTSYRATYCRGLESILLPDAKPAKYTP